MFFYQMNVISLIELVGSISKLRTWVRNDRNAARRWSSESFKNVNSFLDQQFLRRASRTIHHMSWKGIEKHFPVFIKRLCGVIETVML